eukprot:tig00000448_g839.t1
MPGPQGDSRAIANVVYLDQPVGTGFSTVTGDRKYARNEAEVADDVHEFLQLFLRDRPALAARPLYLTGESYAGHYIPAVAHRILKGPRGEVDLLANLKGVAIGNGWVNPAAQYPAYAEFAYRNKLIGRRVYEKTKGWYKECEADIALGKRLEAFADCQSTTMVIVREGGDFNIYDVRRPCEGPLCYKDAYIARWLRVRPAPPRPAPPRPARPAPPRPAPPRPALDPQRPAAGGTSSSSEQKRGEVRRALGVGSERWHECSSRVYDELHDDWTKDWSAPLADLLHASVPVLVYNGDKVRTRTRPPADSRHRGTQIPRASNEDAPPAAFSTPGDPSQDFICNWMGGLAWTSAMRWSGQAAFAGAEAREWRVAGRPAGSLKAAGPLAFLRVSEAGHMVPMDQPRPALALLRALLRGSFWA